jgi:hypothetical protein
MAKTTIVSAMENDTGRGLLSEVFSIPMLIRGSSSTRLLTNSDMSTSFFFPTLVRSSPFSGLTSGDTTFGKFLPEILR